MALVCVGVLGLGSAFVLAGSKSAPGEGKVAICHAPLGQEGEKLDLITPDASGDLNGHANHPFDIIPAIGSNPGKNLLRIYPGGWPGAVILANDCEIPTGGEGITSTITTTLPGTTVSVPATTVTLPGTTVTREATVTIDAPAQTVTTPGATTVVTVPSGATTTVTLPSATVTLPGVTQTISGGNVERDPVTVTLGGTTKTVTAGSTSTVVTVTAPANHGVEGAVAGSKRVTVTVKTPRRTVQVHAHAGMFAGKKFTVFVIHACSAVVRGKG